MEGNTELSPFHTILALFETEDDDFGPTPGRYTDFEKGKQGHQNKEGCTSRRCNPLLFFPILLSFCIPFLVFSWYFSLLLMPVLVYSFYSLFLFLQLHPRSSGKALPPGSALGLRHRQLQPRGGHLQLHHHHHWPSL